MVTKLNQRDVERLLRAPFTYAPVGGTQVGQSNPGYEVFTRSARLPGTSFDEAGERLMTWRVHERAGLRVASSADRASRDAVVVMRLGPGPFSLTIPCRVVCAVEETNRVGFVYGTLPGHPESGEEAFLIERNGDEVRFQIRAFSRPSSRLARLAGPLGRQFQRIMTDRYLQAAGG